MEKAKETYTTDVVIDDDEEQLKNSPTAAEHLDSDAGRDAWNDEVFTALFEREAAEQFHADWLEIQSHFVDDPKAAVRDADELVNDMIENITNAFADKLDLLEEQWQPGDQSSTEDLRVTLRHYRSFFDRLLALAS